MAYLSSAPANVRTSAPKPVSALAQAALPKNPGASVPRNREPVTGAYPGTYPAPKPAAPPVKPRGTVPPGQVPAIADQQTQQQKLYDTYIQPLIDAITGASTTRSQQGDAAIKAQTEALQNYQKGVDYGAPYSAAQSMLQAAAQTLGQDVSGVGSSLGSALGSKLAVINDPTVQAAADAVTQTGAQGASQIGSTGLNALAELIANQAGAKEYGLKQPGIAGLAGIQNVGDLERQVSQDQAQQLTDLQSKVPGMINDLTSATKPKVFGDSRGGYYQLNPDGSTSRLTKPLPTSATAKTPKTISTRDGIFRVNQDGTITMLHAASPAAEKTHYISNAHGIYRQLPDGSLVQIEKYKAGGKSGGSSKLQKTTVNGHVLLYDSSTGDFIDPRTRQPVDPNSLTAKAGGGSLTPGEIRTAAAAAQKIAGAAWNGKPQAGAAKAKTWNGHPVTQMKLAEDGTPDPVSGTAHWVYRDPKGNLVALGPADIPQITSQTPLVHQTYQQAMRDMLAAKIPLDVAQNALNKYWSKPGQTAKWEHAGEGRPTRSYQERNPGKASAAQDAAGKAQTTSYITQRAQQYGLDPAAVLAVASQEGLGGGIGDSGTSFGPWQLHQGGALPASIDLASAHQWAWSPEGIDYALRKMASVAKGLRGQAAIDAIVRRFERPADPDSEVAGAIGAYRSSA